MATPEPLLLPHTLKKAQECARRVKAYKRQCAFLCTLVEKTLSAGSLTEAKPESAQQWDDAVNNIHDRLVEWCELDIVQSFLQSDQIRTGVDKLYGELRWCGMRAEDMQLTEKRRQDEDALRDTLYTIVANTELLERVLKQPPDSRILFVKRLQNAVRESHTTSRVHSDIESALMFLYKHADIRIPTPDLTTQISDIESKRSVLSPLYEVYQGEWLDKESVTIKALKLVQYNDGIVKRFRKEVAAYYSVRHENIVRVYGTLVNEDLGCCLVLPLSPNANALTYLEVCGDTNIVPWLYDISTAIQYLHALGQPILCGCLRAENILIKDDGTGACICDFGLFQLSSQISNGVEDYLRWCAPELIRAARKKDHCEAIYTKQSDIYSLGVVMFELFTSEVPFYHIEDNELLEPEILHGTRPTMSSELKARAHRRGFSSNMHALKKGCWDAEPRKRPNTGYLIQVIESHMKADAALEAIPGKMTDRPESSSSSSVMSRMSNLSTSNSGTHPATPRSASSLLSGSPVSIAAHVDNTTSHEQNYFWSGQVFSEPISVELDRKPAEKKASIGILRKMSTLSIHNQQNASEQTIHPEPRSTFESESSDESHLGQRENTAYERMPKLKPTSLTSSKRRGKDNFDIIISRMTVDGQVDPKWAGVASMESIRGITRIPRRLNQVAAVENLVEHETSFLADTTHEYLSQRLESNPGIIGARLDAFLSSIFEDSLTLRLVNYQFRNALQASSNVSAIGFTRIALLCQEAAKQFSSVYPEYICHLPEVQRIIGDEEDSNDQFSAVLKEQRPGGKTLRKALDDFLRAPVTHLDRHHRTLQYIISEMNSDPEAPVLQEAYQEMIKTVNLVHLSSWQQSEDEKGWKDFVSAETVKSASKADVSRQTLIFELISKERNYVVKLKILQKLLRIILWEIEGLRRKEDMSLQTIFRSLIAAFDDFLRFHRQLLENFFTLQRGQHPWIGPIVAKCGIDQIPWHSLYDHRFGTSYRKLVDLMQEGKVRSGIFKRIMQQEPSLRDESDFMSFLRMPSLHLRHFVDSLRAISDLLTEESEDHQVISDMFPRLWDVSLQVGLKTSASKERARLSSLSAALDFSSYPSMEYDIDITSTSRAVIMSGNLHLGVASPQSGRISLNERFALLLDNYLLFATKTNTQGYLRLSVCERPLPLDLISLSVDDIPPTAPSDALFPCVKLHYIGQTPIFLYGETEYATRIWCSKLQESQTARIAEAMKTKVINMETIHTSPKPLLCSAEFSYVDQTVLAIAQGGQEGGIWLRQGSDPNLRHVVALNGVTDLTVMNEVGILMVLAEKSLFWYRLENLMKGNHISQRSVDESMAVDFYRTGNVGNRSFLVVSAKKKEKTLLRFFEVIETGSSSKMRQVFRGKFGLFNLITEVELTYLVKDIYFLKNSFVLVTNTFYIVKFEDAQQLKESLLSTQLQALPLADDPLPDLAERCRSSVPLAFHKFKDDFILCYKDFASYINVNGQLSSKFVEWESRNAQNIIFRSPYMFILGVSTVEVRQIATGKLEQLLAVPGYMRLSWERRQNESKTIDLSIHLLTSADPDNATSGQSYALHKKNPYNLYRLLYC